MFQQPLPARAKRRIGPPAIQSSALFDWRARFGIDALSGQIGDFVRPATTTAIDAAGQTITVPYGRPAYEWRDLDGDGVRERLVLLCDTNDAMLWPVEFQLQPWRMVLEFVHEGHEPTGALVHMGDDAGNGPSFTIRSSGGMYRVTFDDGVGSPVYSAMTGSPSVGQHVILVADLKANGSVQLRQSIAGGAMVAGTPSGTATLPAALSQPTLRLNAYGTTGAKGAYMRCTIFPGLPTLEDALVML